MTSEDSPTTIAEESLPLTSKLLEHLMENLTANPLTGEIGLEDFTRCLLENSHVPEVQGIMKKLAGIAERDQAAAAQVDDADIDFASLPFDPSLPSVWSLSVEEGQGAVDASGHTVPEGTQGSKPQYVICVNCMHVSRYYCTSVGLPDSEMVLRTLKRAMARPFHMFYPALPKLLLIPFHMSHHVPVLKPFLETLPAPFMYNVEDADSNERWEAFREMQDEADYAQLMRLARKRKDAANVEFKAGLRENAIKAYTSAIDCGLCAGKAACDEEESAESRALLAICYSNRAATHLLPGAGMDTRLARVDGEKAISADVLYTKGHIRLVRAYEAEGDIANAMKSLKGALDVPELSRDPLLLQLLQELKTKHGDAVQ